METIFVVRVENGTKDLKFMAKFGRRAILLAVCLTLRTTLSVSDRENRSYMELFTRQNCGIQSRLLDTL